MSDEEQQKAVEEAAAKREPLILALNELAKRKRAHEGELTHHAHQVQELLGKVATHRGGMSDAQQRINGLSTEAGALVEPQHAEWSHTDILLHLSDPRLDDEGKQLFVAGLNLVRVTKP